jgi:hypothetical protein
MVARAILMKAPGTRLPRYLRRAFVNGFQGPVRINTSVDQIRRKRQHAAVSLQETG